MRKLSAFIGVLVSLVLILFTYQNCGRSDNAEPAGKSLVFSETDNTTAGSLAVDPALLAEVCLSFGGVYDATQDPPCIIDYFDSISMNELSERICVQLGGVYDVNRTPECALPFVLRNEFINAIINIQNQIQSLRDQLGLLDVINTQIEDLQNQINNLPVGITQEDLDAALAPLSIQISQLEMQLATLDLTGFVLQADLTVIVDGINSEINTIKTQITALQGSTGDNTQAIAGLNTQIELLQSDLTSLSNRYDALLTQFNDLVASVSNFQNQVDDILANMATQSDLQAVSDSLTGLFNDLNSRLNVLENMNLVDTDALDQALAPISSQISTIITDIQNLVANSVTNEVFETSVMELSSQLNQLTLNLQLLTGNVSDNTVVINAILSQLSLIESRLTNLENSDQVQQLTIDQLRSDLQSNISSLEQWLTRLDDGQTAQAQQITSILGQLQNLEGQISTNTSNISQLNNDFSALMQELMSVNLQLDAIQQQVDENSQNILNILSRINVLDATVADLLVNGVTQDQLQAVVDSLIQDIAALLQRLGTVDQTLLVQNQSIVDLQLEIEEIRALIEQNGGGNGGDVNNFIVIINIHGKRLRQILAQLLPVIQKSGDASSILESFYRVYDNMDRNACLAIGGDYDANRNPRCQLNMYNKLDLRKLTNQSCTQGESHSLSIACESGFELIGCTGSPGGYFDGGYRIKANYNQDSCTLEVDSPMCAPSQAKTQQNIVAVCARWIGGTRCDSGQTWNEEQQKCVNIQCPHGMYLSGGRCKVKTYCNSDEIKVFGRCVRKPNFKACRQPNESKCSRLLSLPSGFPLTCDCEDSRWSYLKDKGFCQED